MAVLQLEATQIILIIKFVVKVEGPQDEIQRAVQIGRDLQLIRESSVPQPGLEIEDVRRAEIHVRQGGINLWSRYDVVLITVRLSRSRVVFRNVKEYLLMNAPSLLMLVS